MTGQGGAGDSAGMAVGDWVVWGQQRGKQGRMCVSVCVPFTREGRAHTYVPVSVHNDTRIRVSLVCFLVNPHNP